MSTSEFISNHRGHGSWSGARLAPTAEREAIRARRHPLSRWYICPVADRLTARLVRWPARPWQLTLAGLACGIAAAFCVASPAGSPASAAILVLAAWFFDRTDGMLARRLGTSDRSGAWLDANTDEIIDLGLQVCVASAAARMSGSSWPGIWLVSFLLGKYLLMHGLSSDRDGTAAAQSSDAALPQSWLRWLYHLPGNADVRVHLLVAALLTGWLTEQLAVIAVYYNLRWIVRYVRGLKLAVEAST